MAELILSRVGGAIGGHFGGSFFRSLGQAAGALIGSQIDQALFSPTRHAIGPRMTDLHLQGSTEGASVPAVYGRVRLAGQVIWAARFKEHVQTREVSGGKGAPSAKVTNYRYSLSFAVGLCEGEVKRVTRAWANGQPFDLSAVEWRLHRGGEDQAPDAVIEAIEGVENAPAYRGLAYIVFEDLPLDAFGNAMPQFSFEIERTPPSAATRMEDLIQGVCLIPGSGEFAYATDVVRRKIAAGRETLENAHAEQERANLLVSLDQLEQDLPNCASVVLVVAWFGTDLRCGACEIKPGVEIAAKTTRPLVWRAGGVTRDGAHVVSLHDGAPAYGGTPSDESVVQAIAALKARGFRVCLYPFVLMDVPSGNGLPDPYGGAEQAAYPWRGRITCHPAADESGTVDKTGAAATQVDAFFGAATAAHFSASGTTISYGGPSEWSYRRFILHYAELAQAAGDVDALIIGSELRGLTTVRSSASAYPAVAKLKSLAADVRALLGAGTKLTYAADWSEYFGHQPQDGSGDVFFHLDPLWADSAIDAVGIDWYPPLTDWRDGPAHEDLALSASIHNPVYLASRVEAGENYDWFYASDADRAAQTRTPITDGAYNKPWVFRAKDVRNWWANAHYDRPGGVESATPTAWSARSKPIWFVEIGVPAIDKGTNAPNLFVDPKSAESAAPPFSSRAPDDFIQRRALEAYLTYWNELGANNPTSPSYGGPMLDLSFAHIWAWDARPFPHYPGRVDLWTDGPNWRLGHWLNGRAGAALLSDVVRDLAKRAGDEAAQAEQLLGIVPGYVADAPATARALIEPLMATFGFDAREQEGALVFAPRDAEEPSTLAFEQVLQGEDSRISITRIDGADAPREARVRFIDPSRDYRLAMASALQRDAAGAGVSTVDAPICLDAEVAEVAARRLLAEASASVETARVGVPPSLMAVEPGDRIILDAPGAEGVFRAASLDHDQLTLLGEPPAGAPTLFSPTPSQPGAPGAPSAPDLLILDLPPLPNAEADERPLAAVFAAPWPGAVDILAGTSAELATLRATAERPAVVGELLWALWPGPEGRWDDGNVTRIALTSGAPGSLSDDAVLAGGNAFAIQNEEGEWEILQARDVTLVSPGIYELRGLLRGQQGTEGAMRAPVAVGARIVLLDERLVRIDMRASELMEDVLFVAAPAGRTATDPASTALTATWRRVWARPFSPVHIQGVRSGAGDLAISWTRRSRLGGDAWAGEPPLGEESEAWLVEILDAGAPVRSFSLASPAVTYTAAEQTADFGGVTSPITVRIAQISESFGAGQARESVIWV